MTKEISLEFIAISKLPSKSVLVPNNVPFTPIFAANIGSPVSISVTFPLI